MIAPIPEEGIQEVQNRLREHFAPVGPGVANVGVVLVLGDPLVAPFRGRMYEVPPISWKDGVRCVELRQELEAFEGAEATPEVVRAYRRTLARLARFIGRRARPDRGRLRRVLWRLRLLPNPFRRATERELGEWLGFFFTCRTVSSGHPAPSLPTRSR